MRCRKSILKSAVLGPRWSSVNATGPNVCIVGTGPAGFYTAKYLLRRLPTVGIDMVEGHPVPFGLVRFGVAPDHPEVKSVQAEFSALMRETPRLSYYGNVWLGSTIKIEELRDNYDAVVLACGAEDDRLLGIPGETALGGILGARAFVNWYNGHPDFSNIDPPLQTHDTAVIIGNGNVAVDCARMLLRSTDELATTDIAEHALQALRESHIRRVLLVGRRGPIQAAFTTKELRELTRLSGVSVTTSERDFVDGWTDASQVEVKPRPKKRQYDLLQTTTRSEGTGSGLASHPLDEPNGRWLGMEFLWSPSGWVEKRDTGMVGGITLRRNKLEGDAGHQSARPTPEEVHVDCGLVLRSIGYRSPPIPGVPHDNRRGVIPNKQGRVTDQDVIIPALYCAGWSKRGSNGIIGTNIQDAQETVEALAADVEGGVVGSGKPGGAGLEAILSEEGHQWLTWSDYEKIDDAEVKAGDEVGKPREKIVHTDDMLTVVR